MSKKFFLFTIIVLMAFSSGAQTLPDGFSLTDIASGSWTEPVGTAFNSSGSKMFVWEKRGQVFVCNWDNATHTYIKQTTPVLNISEEVGNWRDHGLLGFAVDPDFDTNGLIYLLYVVDRYYLLNYGKPGYNANSNTYFAATIGRITRYQTIMSGSNLVASLPSRTILLGESKTTGIPILHESHGVGTLAFAADGTLLASCGDAASYDGTDAGSFSGTYWNQALNTDHIIRPAENVGAFRSQLLNCFNGKILRLDPTNGNGVSSNPFFNPADPRAPQSRVWALGFRNPFRFYIKPNSGSTNPAAGDIGEIYVSDVGWSDVEEVDIIKSPGQNAGWPFWEGMEPNTSYSSLNTLNKDEPNPQYGINGCTQQYFKFKDLIKDALTSGDNTVYNPCDGSPIVSGNPVRFSHYPPAIDWNHSAVSARVPVFGSVTYTPEEIGSPQSDVIGTPFSGFCSSGGCWYRYDKYPAQYKNTYFFADLSGSWIKNMQVQFTNRVKAISDFSTGFGAVIQISESPKDSLLYIIDMGGDAIRRLDYGGNRNPVVEMSADLYYAPSPFNVNFTGHTSYDPDGDAITYSWDFGDGSPLSTAADPSHSFSAPDANPHKFVVKLTVTDINGGVSTDSLIISANNTPPSVDIISPIDNSLYVPGPDTTYTLQANVTDAEQGPDQLFYQWQTFLRHNTHQHPEAIDTNKITSAVISRIGCNGDSYYWLVTLAVTDAAGLRTVDSSRIIPYCGGPLPLKLLSFSVKGNGKVNALSWTTAEENNVSHFDVERSYNGNTFSKIGRVEANHNQNASSYGFNDSDFLDGYVYYRLKMVDADNQYAYSFIVRVFSGKGKSNDITVSPNPFTSDIFVAADFAKEGTVELRFVDAKGVVVKKLLKQVNAGFNTFNLEDLQVLANGVYFLEISQGGEVRKVKLVKQ